MTFNRTVLNNGLRIITVPMPSLNSATVLVMVGAGSRYERKDNNGISHFLEHMAFKGTKNRPNPLIISTQIDSLGGENNAFTGKETTAYYIKAGANHVETMLDIISDMLKNSLFDSTEIEKEKGVIIEEINMYEDSPMQKIGDVYEELLYGDTPMGWDIAGQKDVIRAANRDYFTSYLASLYSADNMTVVVAGGVKSEEVEALVTKYFGDIAKFETIKAPKVVDGQEKSAILIKPKSKEQVHIALGVRTTPLEHPDRYALDVLAEIMGGGMSGRLFHEVREKRGLAYYVRSMSDNYTDVGTLVTSAGVDPNRVDQAVEVIVEEYKKLTMPNNITEEELKRGKEMAKGQFVLSLENSRTVASFFAHQEILESKVQTPEEIMKQIDEVTLEKIGEVAKKYLSQPLSLAVIGNVDSQKLETLLK